MAQPISLDFALHPRQLEAFTSPATEILYGGAAGGGKSFLMRISAILSCLEVPGLQVYLFRRQSTDLQKNHIEGPSGFPILLAKLVKAELVKIVYSPNCEISFKNGPHGGYEGGSKIFLCHCKDENNKYNYQGSEIHYLCVGRGTPVLMSDGSYKAVEDISPGDMAMTLRGPRMVTNAFRPGLKECVRVTTPFGEQVQSVEHQVLTPAGWISWGDLRRSSSHSCASTPLQTSDKSQRQPGKKCHVPSPVDGRCTSRQRLSPEQAESSLGHSGCMVTGASGEDAESCFGASCGERPEELQLQELSFLAVLHAPGLQEVHTSLCEEVDRNVCTSGSSYSPQELQRPFSPFCASVAPLGLLPEPASVSDQQSGVGISRLRTAWLCGAPGTSSSCCESGGVRGSSPLSRHGCHPLTPCDAERERMRLGTQSSFQGRCSAYSGQCDEQPLRESATDRAGRVRPQVCAGEHTRRALLPLDAMGHVQERSRSCLRRYAHPYTGEIREATLSSVVDSCSVSYVGFQEVFDLTIDDENHYITKSGLVNRNCIDELTHMSDTIYTFLRSRVRLAGLKIPPHVPVHKYPRILCGSNPGGVGHGWVKQFFIDHADPMSIRQMPDEDGGLLRQFIPAKLADNPTLLENDPKYASRLKGLGNEALVKAMLDGDWDVFVGQAFDFNKKYHVIPPRPVPAGATIWMSLDWGYGAPFAVGWFWADGDGRIYMCGEWYGWTGKPNQGLRLTDTELALGIIEREKEMGFAGRDILRYAGHDCFSKKPSYESGGQGPSTAERFAGHGLFLIRNDPDKARKLRQFYERLRVPEDGTAPMFQVYDTCKQTIRTIPTLVMKEDNPEVLEDHGAEDHCFCGTTMVETEDGPEQIQNLVGREGYLFTAGGIKTRYHSCRKTRRDAAVVEVLFADGRSVICTPDHRFFASSMEYVEAKDLVGVDVVDVEIARSEGFCSQLSSMKQRRLLMDSTTGSAGTTFSEKAGGFIVLFGNTIMGQCRKVITSITRMATEATTTLTTWNSKPGRSTSQTTRRASQTQTGSRLPRPALRCGMEVQMAESGTSTTTSSIVNTSCTPGSRSDARGAELNLKGITTQSFAARSASLESSAQGYTKKSLVSSAATNSEAQESVVRKLVQRGSGWSGARVVSVKQVAPRDVYCLVADDTAAFCVEGGLLVHNCYDAIGSVFSARPLGNEEAFKPKTPEQKLIESWETGSTTETSYVAGVYGGEMQSDPLQDVFGGSEDTQEGGWW